MFENDDFDDLLSQFSCPELIPVNRDAHLDNKQPEQSSANTSFKMKSKMLVNKECARSSNKRVLLENIFNSTNKRKFPGPAGLLTGSMHEHNDDNISQLHIVSQDLNESRNYLSDDRFSSELWLSVVSDPGNRRHDTISSVKQRASDGTLSRQKADRLFALIQSIDRSVADPPITLRDTTGEMKGTLHRDAWSAFSPYLLPGFAVLTLSKPTVLTTGNAAKKHYLNITMDNILAVHCSKPVSGQIIEIKRKHENCIPDCFTFTETEDLIAIKRREGVLEDESKSRPESQDESDVAQQFLNGLDVASFCEDFTL